MKLTIIGLGQALRGDDSAGLEALRAWQTAFPKMAARSDIDVKYAGLPGLGLLDLLKGCDAAILVDAVKSSAAPGTIHRLDPSGLEAFASGSGSAHGWGVAETLLLARQLNAGSDAIRIRLIGIEAKRMDVGSPMSATVQGVLPAAAQAIQEEVEALLA